MTKSAMLNTALFSIPGAMEEFQRDLATAKQGQHHWLPAMWQGSLRRNLGATALTQLPFVGNNEDATDLDDLFKGPAFRTLGENAANIRRMERLLAPFGLQIVRHQVERDGAEPVVYALSVQGEGEGEVKPPSPIEILESLTASKPGFRIDWLNAEHIQPFTAWLRTVIKSSDAPETPQQLVGVVTPEGAIRWVVCDATISPRDLWYTQTEKVGAVKDLPENVASLVAATYNAIAQSKLDKKKGGE